MTSSRFPLTLAFAVAVFFGSFLNFLVQPLMGKYILPWYGGTPAVWTTCLLFFQLMLVLGYAYAHLVGTRLRPVHQAVVHIGVLVASLAFLPLAPDVSWRQASSADPTWRILGLLSLTVGAPYLILSASAPLVQKWFSLVHVDRSPYRLYALSNVASLGALLAYPAVFEPRMTLLSQAGAWSLLYAGYAIALAVCAAQLCRSPRAARGAAGEATTPVDRPSASVTSGTHGARADSDDRVDRFDHALWVVLSALGSAMLMATTNKLTQDVMPVPLLWVLPLAIYLLTFVICFDRPQWYKRGFFTWLFVSAVIVHGIWAWQDRQLSSFGATVAIHAVLLFGACMCCHGELVARRPAARHLTWFYLAIAVGGAIGGLLVVVAAPMLLTDYREHALTTVAVCVALLTCRREEKLRASWSTRGGRRVLVGAMVVGALLLVLSTRLPGLSLSSENYRHVAARRNFYGVLLVRDYAGDNPRQARRSLSHGTTEHGFQYLHAELAREPTSYYDRASGVGRVLQAVRRGMGQRTMRLCVIGLGTGTLAAYSQPGDFVVFYEINPLVVEIAQRDFTFLGDARGRRAEVHVRLGDARLAMEAELAAGRPGAFDVLVVDAFSGDAIPVHLLTRECFDVYFRHLADGGALAVHISNRYLNLAPIVAAHTRRADHRALLVHRLSEPASDVDRTAVAGSAVLKPTSSTWVIVTRRGELVEELASQEQVEDITQRWNDFREWTDDYSSLLAVLRRGQTSP